MTPIYKHSNGATIYQCGYREIPWNLKDAGIGLVIYMAAECPPLNHHHHGAKLEHWPTNDSLMEPGSFEYIKTLGIAKKAAKSALKHIQKGHNVIISCHMGLNRSGLCTGLVLKELTKADPQQVVEWIQRKRRGALGNSSFVNMLY